MRTDKAEVALEASLVWGMKNVSSGEGDTPGRDAVNRANGTVYGQVMSCSRGREGR